MAQSVARERSSEIREHISCELRPVLNKEVSSANIEHSLGIDRGRSSYPRKIGESSEWSLRLPVRIKQMKKRGR